MSHRTSDRRPGDTTAQRRGCPRPHPEIRQPQSVTSRAQVSCLQPMSLVPPLPVPPQPMTLQDSWAGRDRHTDSGTHPPYKESAAECSCPAPGQVCSEPTMRLCHPRCGRLSRRLCPLPGLSTALPAMWTELLLTAGRSWTVSLPVPQMAESHCAPGARAVLRGTCR